MSDEQKKEEKEESQKWESEKKRTINWNVLYENR